MGPGGRPRAGRSLHVRGFPLHAAGQARRVPLARPRSTTRRARRRPCITPATISTTKCCRSAWRGSSQWRASRRR